MFVIYILFIGLSAYFLFFILCFKLSAYLLFSSTFNFYSFNFLLFSNFSLIKITKTTIILENTIKDPNTINAHPVEIIWLSKMSSCLSIFPLFCNTLLYYELSPNIIKSNKIIPELLIISTMNKWVVLIGLINIITNI